MSAQGKRFSDAHSDQQLCPRKRSKVPCLERLRQASELPGQGLFSLECEERSNSPQRRRGRGGRAESLNLFNPLCHLRVLCVSAVSAGRFMFKNE
jgi:hypothetical protein